MGTKKITDLQLIADPDATLNLPSDDGIQSYRITLQQIKDFILSDEAILRDMIQTEERMPVGSVLAFAGTSAPDGFLLCNGAAIDRTTYSDLYDVIGITHGQGNGTTTFNLPDYRGRFLRGLDGGVGRDPDRASRTAMATGGATGDNVGSVQDDAYENHDHADTLAAPAHTHASSSLSNCNRVGKFSGSAPTEGPGVGSNVFTGATAATVSSTGAATATALTGSVSTSTTGSTESRPKNANVNYIIKF